MDNSCSVYVEFSFSSDPDVNSHYVVLFSSDPSLVRKHFFDMPLFDGRLSHLYHACSPRQYDDFLTHLVNGCIGQ